jgi:hypothetical protein
MRRQNSNLCKIGSRPGPLADWNVGASVGTGTGTGIWAMEFADNLLGAKPKEE